MASTAAADCVESVEAVPSATGRTAVADGAASVPLVPVPVVFGSAGAVVSAGAAATGSDTVSSRESRLVAAATVVAWPAPVPGSDTEVSAGASSGRPPRVSTCLRRVSFSWCRRRSSTTTSSRKSSTSSWS